MNVLVIGSGGREHALCWALAASPTVTRVCCAPGNAGIAEVAECVPLRVDDLDGIVAFARDRAIDLVVVGPELPLVLGLVDRLEAAGVKAFGPSAAAARLEGSKAFTKAFCKRHGIPTARFRTFGHGEAEAAEAYVAGHPLPVVVKADGLAAGKGVVVAATRDEALEAVRAATGGAFGQAGETLVVEEFLVGEEASLFALCDGTHALEIGTAQDHKRAFDGDQGPNTGGMGAYSPAPVVTPAVHARIMREVIHPTVQGMAADGIPYTGFLYAGVMVDAQGAPKVLEFNCRLGDPETQPILMRLKSDLVDLAGHAARGTLDRAEVEWDRRSALGVVLAAAGYPESPRRGDRIDGLDRVDASRHPDAHVFHAGTASEGDAVVTSGGRVLCVTALGDSVRQAQRAAYAAAAEIRFDGMQFRTDIGHRAIQRKA